MSHTIFLCVTQRRGGLVRWALVMLVGHRASESQRKDCRWGESRIEGFEDSRMEDEPISKEAHASTKVQDCDLPKTP
jgi:hypothetical protein